MKSKKMKVFFSCFVLCLLATTIKAQSTYSKATVETQGSIPGSGYDCLGVWKMISPSPHDIKNGVFECRIDLPPESSGRYWSYIYGPSIIFRSFTSNYLDLKLDMRELIPESKITGGLVTYELVVPKWVDNFGNPVPPETGVLCHYHIEVRLNNLY